MNRPIDFTKHVQTRDGRKVTVYTTDAFGLNRPVIGQIDGEQNVRRWRINGTFSKDPYILLPADIVNVPEKRVVYVNLYPYPHLSPGFHPTRKDADKYAMNQRHACVRVEYTEGQFDD